MVRPTLACILVAMVVLVGSGCAGNREPAPITATATEVSVAESVLSEMGYARATDDAPRFTTSGQATISGDVQMDLRYRFNATTSRTVYTQPGPPPRVFGVWAVPLIEPEDVALTVDPLRNTGPATIADRAQDQYTDVSVTGDPGGNVSTTVLGTDVTVAVFEATGVVDGSRTEISLSVARLTHDGDVVAAVAITPRGQSHPEAVRTLLNGVRH